tara:strand:+ start:45257 stop:46081 length:825 start_codon:yes stop_codon:yes gene_type:complete
MKFLKRLFDFYIDASVHVALAVLSLLHVTDILLNIPIDHHLNLFVFFGSISAYNFIKYGVEAEKYILVATRYHKNIQFFSIIALIIALYHVFFLSRDAIYFMMAMVLMTGLYAIPVLPNMKNLRNFGGLKIFIVSFVWAGTTVMLPALATFTPISWDIIIEFIQRFLLVLILLVPFEIRDLAYDAPELRTLPQRIGVSNTRIFGSFAVVIFYVLTFLKDNLTIIDGIGKGVLFLALGFTMLFTEKVQKKYFASFWVEAIPIIWWGLLVVLLLFI